MSKNKEQAKTYLQLLDIVCIIISFILATWIRYGIGLVGWYESLYSFIFILLILCYFCIFHIFDFYTGIFKRGFFDEFICVMRLNLILALLISGILFISQRGGLYSRSFFAFFFFFNVWITYVARQYFKVLLLSYYKKSGASNKIMVITTSYQAADIIAKMRREREWEFQVTKFGIVDKDMVGESIRGIPVKANKDTLLEVVTKGVVDEVFISVPFNPFLKLDEIILELENMGITVNISITTFGLNAKEKTIKTFGGYHVLTFSTKAFNKTSMVLKRGMDILGALIGLLITGMVSIFIAPAILLESPGPLIFSQTRVGKNGRRFKIYKFRSMCVDAERRKMELIEQNEMEGLMFKITNDPRVTKVGKFIRKTSIDELPQFYNVLRGDMSLVGTRPPTEDEFLQYESRHKRRLTLRPGITGLWQVSGRSDIENFEDVVKMDLEYIDHWSFLLDIRLLVKTVFVVIFRVGAK